MGVDGGVTVAEVTGAQQRSWSWALEPRIEGCASGGKREERGKREEKNTCTKTKAKIIICIDKTKLELIVMTH